VKAQDLSETRRFVRRRRTSVGIALALLSALLPLTATPLTAQKTDVVILENGDHITGEIKLLARGRLSYSTDDMGTLSIEWEKIVRISSRHYHEVELVSGLRYFGNLQEADTGQVVVSLAEQSDTLDLARIVRIEPIESSFLQRFNGRIDLGFTYQSASRIMQLSLGGEVNYRTQKWKHKLNFDAYFQDQEAASSTKRSSLGFLGQRFLARKWSGFVGSSLEQNQELNLDLRILLSAGGGLYFVQTNHAIFNVLGGLSVTDERFTGEADRSNSLEALLAVEYSYFRFDSPKTDLSTSLFAYPSLTDFGRVRLDFDVYVSYEILSDFTIGLTIFDKFDNRASEGTAKNDFGTTLSVGWKF
jgi:hypothetical protein